MKVKLFKRHYGVHDPKKEIEINALFYEVYIGEDNIDEKLLLQELPKDFLPCKPREILLTVGDGDGSTGQRGLKRFKNWAKYFDAYVLKLVEP